jgi:hypothetical protein
MKDAKAGEQAIIMATKQVSHIPNPTVKREFIPIEHSSIVHSINHLGSGVVAFPLPSTPTCKQRIVAKAMQIKPLPNNTKMPIFCLRGI